MAQTDYENISDEGLMERISNTQDHQAFCHLVQKYTDQFYRAAYRICHNEMEAEDIVQEAFLKIWSGKAAWKTGKGAKFTTWFYRVIVNMSIDQRRKNKPAIYDEFEIADSKILQDEAMIKDLKERSIEMAIQNLPEKQAIALNLCFYEGLSNKEAADIMKVGVKAIESLLMRAKANLRDELIRVDMIEERGHKHG